MTGPLERTGQRIVAGTWGCAAITMAASAANAALTYGALGDNRVLGLATGLAVDIGLCVALIGDRQLYEHGLSSTWGRALRITTAVMSLILNVGISLRDGHYFAALLHSFLPVLLIVMTEYGQDVLLQFTALRQQREAAQQAQVAPMPVAEAVPQLHQPFASPPVAATRVEPVPAVSPTPRPTPPPARAPKPSPPKPTPPTEDALVTRLRRLIRDNDGHAPGRRTVAKQLGITEHQARVVLDQLVSAGSPDSNGAGRARSAGNGQVP